MSMNLSPLAIYYFPCNVTFTGIRTSWSSCPLFDQDTITYVKWDSATDNNLLDLHYKSLKIPPPITINKTFTTELDEEIGWYDSQLTQRINQAKKEIDKIKETSFTTFQIILIYVAVTLFILNFILICVCCSCLIYKGIPAPHMGTYNIQTSAALATETEIAC